MPEESQTTQPAVTQPSEPMNQVLGNDPSARTSTGEMKDQATVSKPESTTEAKPDETTEPTTPVVPESYTFKAPDGKELDARTVEAATPVFRELGLNNDQAQRLVDFWNERVGDATKLATETIATQRKEWVDAVKADPVMGGKLDQIKADVGRALDVVLTKEERAAFNEAMNFTGAGDHPGFIRAYWKMAQAVIEGKHVSGGGPSGNGQKAPGAAAKPTAAQAMYPNLTH